MRILFVCKDHGTRSRMAEQLAKRIMGADFQIESAGLTVGTLNQVALQALRDAGDEHPTVGRALKSLNLSAYHLAVVVGSERDIPPALPSQLKRVTWPLMEPQDPPASPQELKSRFRELHEALLRHIKALAKAHAGAKSRTQLQEPAP